MLAVHARPKVHVAYLREAYENPENNAVRLTFDRRVESAPQAGSQLIARSERPHLVFGRTVILELKFTARYPKWFRELVETFDLMQAGAAKFAEGIFTKGEDWVHDECMPKTPESVLDEFLSGKGYRGLFKFLRATKD
jgi:hypothetical protein